MIMTDMLDPNGIARVDRRRIESMETSKVSMMPGGLLDTLKEDEVLDLLAYLLSRGARRQSDVMAAGRRLAPHRATCGYTTTAAATLGILFRSRRPPNHRMAIAVGRATRAQQYGRCRQRHAP